MCITFTRWSTPRLTNLTCFMPKWFFYKSGHTRIIWGTIHRTIYFTETVSTRLTDPNISSYKLQNKWTHLWRRWKTHRLSLIRIRCWKLCSRIAYLRRLESLWSNCGVKTLWQIWWTSLVGVATKVMTCNCHHLRVVLTSLTIGFIYRFSQWAGSTGSCYILHHWLRTPLFLRR